MRVDLTQGADVALATDYFSDLTAGGLRSLAEVAELTPMNFADYVASHGKRDGVATWADVARIAGRLPGARPGHAPEGSPSFDVGRHPFARLRWDDDEREIRQFWSLELDSGDALADRRDTFFAVYTFKVKVSIWAWLDRLDEEELTEILTDSWLARRGVHPT